MEEYEEVMIIVDAHGINEFDVFSKSTQQTILDLVRWGVWVIEEGKIYDTYAFSEYLEEYQSINLCQYCELKSQGL